MRKETSGQLCKNQVTVTAIDLELKITPLTATVEQRQFKWYVRDSTSALVLIIPYCYSFLPNERPYVFDHSALSIDSVNFNKKKAKWVWKMVPVLVFMFRAKPIFDSLSRIDKMAECENDTVWHWAKIFESEVESITEVDVTKPSEDETAFFARFCGVYEGRHYYFGLKKSMARFEGKVEEAVNQLTTFIKLNTEDLPGLNMSLEFFKALGAVFDVTL